MRIIVLVALVVCQFYCVSSANAMGTSEEGLLVVMTRPPNVPDNFVPTPNGWFDPTCVIEVGKDEKVLGNGDVVRSDGAISHHAIPCTSSRYDMHGRMVDATNPAASGWIEWADSISQGPLSYVSAQWNVPLEPPSNGSQIVYFFPGLENAAAVDTILQPVLGWNQFQGPSGWSIASWNCCLAGVTWHSAFLPTFPGAYIRGYMQGTNCLLSGVCTSWTITATNPDGGSVSLQTTVSSPMDYLVGSALEAYNLNTCSQLPASSSVTVAGFVLRTPLGANIAVPAWNPRQGFQTPQCSYNIASPGSVSLGWSASPQVCTPNSWQDCCSFAKGCSCDGTQTCRSDGTGWGACIGATPIGNICQ